jgi:hypothetical protein
MPIRLNLLAEAHALEDQRRRDPAKRALWAGFILVAAVLVWSSSLQMRVMVVQGELNRIEGQLNSRSNEYNKVVQSMQKLSDVRRKLVSLEQLTTNRFLHGSALNALQQTALEEVELHRFRTDQTYVQVPESKPATNESKRVTPGKPASVVEKIVITLDAHDVSATPGDQVSRFKQSVAASSYFQSLLTKTNEPRLTSLAPPSPPATGGKPFVGFTLECRAPDRTHL